MANVIIMDHPLIQHKTGLFPADKTDFMLRSEERRVGKECG